MEMCSTCATILATHDGDALSEKPPPDLRRVPCCGRIICGDCIVNNGRFATYCPYCQISSDHNPLPQGLRSPPIYEAPSPPKTVPPPSYRNSPPPYNSGSSSSTSNNDEKAAAAAAEDTLHFLNHEHDTIPSLSLRYGVPQDALRRANNINSDHLLHARKTVLIPGAYYKAGVSLSPRPVDGEDEEMRKNKIRRLMISCKVADYDVAQLYLAQAGYNLDQAIDNYVGDEAWEQTHQPPGGEATTKTTTRWGFGRRK